MHPVTIPLFAASAALIVAAAGAPTAARPFGLPPQLLAAPGVSLAVQADSPVSVRLLLDHERYVPGSTGQVRVAIGRNGYLLVLYSDPTGHVRVAFPLDPASPSAVTKDTTIEIRSRGDRDAFIVDDSSGVGTWYAAISSQPFQFDSIQLSHHWDYRTIPRVRGPATAERELTEFVERIQSARFEYDIVNYSIGTDSIASSSAGSVSQEADDGGWVFEPTGPFYPGPRASSGPWSPGPWWSEPHWPGPYYDRVVEGVGGAGTVGASVAEGPAGPARPKSFGAGGSASGDHGGRTRY
jgi:hypothetical protein